MPPTKKDIATHVMINVAIILSAALMPSLDYYVHFPETVSFVLYVCLPPLACGLSLGTYLWARDAARGRAQPPRVLYQNALAYSLGFLTFSWVIWVLATVTFVAFLAAAAFFTWRLHRLQNTFPPVMPPAKLDT